MNMLNKRGQGLSMTTIVVIILAILVLLVVSLIFLGGTTGLGQKIQDFFRGGELTSADVAVQNCLTWCDNAEMMSVANQPNSAFCTSVQSNVDINRDGEITITDENEGKVRCHAILVKDGSAAAGTGVGNLGVDCSVVCV